MVIKYLAIILAIIILVYFIYSQTRESFVSETEKPYLWLYWDNLNGKPTVPLIEMCWETIKKHCSKSFTVVRLNKDTIRNWLPELKQYDELMKDLIIAHKVDIYRIMLLHKYGGVYLDSDTIVLRDPIEIVKKFKKYDYVGFGCNGIPCTFSYGKPSNWIMAAPKGSKLMMKILDNQISKLKSGKKIQYHDIGKIVIWEELEKLTKDGYEYYHYNPKYDGSRDVYGNWINSDIIFSNQPIKYENEKDMLFYVFYNSGIDDNIRNLSREELLAKDWNFTKFMKRGLGLSE